MEINKKYLIKNTLLKEVTGDALLEISILDKIKDTYKIHILNHNDEISWVIEKSLNIIGELSTEEPDHKRAVERLIKAISAQSDLIALNKTKKRS